MNGDLPDAAVDHVTPQGSASVRVLAAVIQHGDRYLVGLRPNHKRHGGCWEFPGGKLEQGETILHAARRELKEELGLDVVTVRQPVFIRRDPGSDFVIEFTGVEVAGVPEAREHDEIRWATLKELRSMRLAPSDRAFADQLHG